MTIVYVIVSILMIGLLVLVHEAGHFAAARLTHIPVHEFSIGFGKSVWQRKRDGVTYSLRMIPFGGYVAFADGEDEKGVAGYYSQPVWARFIVAIAGSLTNLLVAFVVLWVFCLAGGVKTVIPVVDTVTANMPAAEAGLLQGDRILQVGDTVIGDDVAKVSEAVNAADGQPVALVVERDGQQMTLTMTPQYNAEEKRYLVGITTQTAPYYMGVGEATVYTFQGMGNAAGQILVFLGNLVTKGEGADQLGSPVGIVSEMTKVAQEYGIANYITIAVFLSVNLGIFNLLPFPALDGSKVIFLIIEAIRRKPVPPEKEGLVQTIGFVLFIGLSIFLVGRDIARLFGWGA